jgi:hypothetical protein
MKTFSRVLDLIIGIGLIGISGIALFYFLINERFEWIPEIALELVRDQEILKRPPAKKCSECHKNIFKAWKESRHSVSWLSETFIEASENRSKEKCLPCHIPQSVQGEKPEPRTDLRDEGIYCVSCHFINNKMHGPYDLLAPPHPTFRNPDYVRSNFCSSCHQKTFKEWKATQIEDTCQDCHMPRKKGRLTQKTGLNLLHKKRWVADHSFLHGKITEKDVVFKATWEENFFNISLENQTIPHFVPTADNGDPRLYVYIKFFNGKEEVDNAKEIIAPQQETALPYNKKIYYRYRLFDAVSKAVVKLKYQPAWSKEKTEVFSKTVTR